MHDDDRPDPDRAAILARRKQFIALAISGLATTSCTDGKSRPQPCLEYAVEPDPDHHPQVCLSIALPPEPAETGETGEAQADEPPSEPMPRPCLNIAKPKD